MIGSLFAGGLGRFVAPYPDKAVDPIPEEAPPRDFWQIIAPDPNYRADASNVEGGSSLPVSAPAVSSTGPQNPPSTPTAAPTATPTATPSPSPSPSFPHTPTTRSSTPSRKQHRTLESAVVEAATSTLETLSSPTPVWDSRKVIFQICSNGKPNAKNMKKLSTSLKKDPTLATCRCAGMASLVPDGFSPLHSAASSGNMEAARILLDFSHAGMRPVSALTIDLGGRTPLHVAAENGHLDMVSLLKAAVTEELGGVVPVGIDAPVDLIGRTPLGWAFTSRHASARKNRRDLERELLVQGDASVCPKTPIFGRSRVKSSEDPMLKAGVVEYGAAEIPGRRVEMEDAVMLHPHKGLYAVFDGHGDGGQAARFVRDNLMREWLTQNDTQKGEDLGHLLTESCMDVDERLKVEYRGREGGSTGVVAILAPDTITIGNVGDSRAILVQKYNQEVKVIAMSNDHNPDIPAERQRIESAGCTIVSYTLNRLQGHEQETIHKIKHPKTFAEIAVSRAFGDYDFKSDPDLPLDRQAVIAIPEIIAKKREPQDLYLILACDGVWDVMSNVECARFVVEQVEDHEGEVALAEVGDRLLQECLDRGSEDNMSVVIVGLKDEGGIEKTLNFDD